MVGLTGKVKKDTTVPTTREVLQNKRNLAGLTPAVLEQDIEYVIFAEHEFPMEHYQKFQPIVADLVELIITHVDSQVRKTQDRLAYDIGKRLQEEVGNIVYGEKIDTIEKVVVKDKILDVSSLMEP